MVFGAQFASFPAVLIRSGREQFAELLVQAEALLVPVFAASPAPREARARETLVESMAATTTVFYPWTEEN